MSTENDPWTIARLLKWTTDYFTGRDNPAPRLDAEVLLAEALGCQRIELYTRFEEVPPEPVRTKFKGFVARRAAGEPVAYLVGRREFYSMDFAVTPGVLVPRPETELLVLTLLDRIKEKQGSVKIADIGTGSGVIAVTIAKQAPNTEVLAVDVSDEALAVAAKNTERHGVADRVRFAKSDLFSEVDPAERFDFIASNPPYVTTNELMNLEPTVRDHEPHLALDGGPEGTTVIERLLPQAVERLNPGGELLIEIGPSTVDRVESLVAQTEGLNLQETHKDLSGHKRVVHAVR